LECRYLSIRFQRLFIGILKIPSLPEPEFRWSGQIMDTIDGLAFIGGHPGDQPNVFILTGDCGVGLTHGTIAGMLITDRVMGRENPWAILYDPARKSPLAALTFTKENLNVASQYASWVTPGEVSSADEIRPGTGAIAAGPRRSLFTTTRPEACTSGRRYVLISAVSWLGTRRKTVRIARATARDLTPDGKVLNGPAIAPRAPAEEKDAKSHSAHSD
jgi:hypothetical protein